MLPKHEFDLLLKNFEKADNAVASCIPMKKHNEITGTRPFYNLISIIKLSSAFLFFIYLDFC